jgi:ribosome modulation factor
MDSFAKKIYPRPHSDLKKEIRKEGYTAKEKGGWVSDCPYAVGSTFRKWWLNGFTQHTLEKSRNPSRKM